jgi:hypothetical protein
MLHNSTSFFETYILKCEQGCIALKFILKKKIKRQKIIEKMQNHCGMKIQNPISFLSSMYMDIKCFLFSDGSWKRVLTQTTITTTNSYTFSDMVFCYYLYLILCSLSSVVSTAFIVLLLYPPHRFLFIR